MMFRRWIHEMSLPDFSWRQRAKLYLLLFAVTMLSMTLLHGCEPDNNCTEGFLPDGQGNCTCIVGDTGNVGCYRTAGGRS